MRRKRVRPYSPTVRPTRILSMLFAIAVLFMFFQRLRDPNFIAQLNLGARAQAADAQPAAQNAVPAAPEILVEGPNDLDPDEVARAQEMFELVNDRAVLKPREMHAYWKLMSWSRTAPFAELQKRSKVDVPFTQLWEEPAKYRGKLVTLRLHVRRVLEYDAPENPQKLHTTYEAWGWTDESKSFPYVVVFPDLPEGMPIGTDVRAEALFVGYFLKVMSYDAFDVKRGAPLLVGRVQFVPPAVSVKEPPVDMTTLGIIVGVAAIVILVFFFWQMRSRKPNAALALEDPAEFTFNARTLPVVDDTERQFEMITTDATSPSKDQIS